jgi:glycogen operon protein
MHVDGFRFDLASALAREEGGPSRLASFFDIVHQDPVLNSVKLIAEPWDVSLGGYQVGGFPVDWSEWNGRYRDTVRRYWKGDHGLLADMAYRLAGSSDLYRDDGRSPAASVNFITCHDGFTLHDLVSYQNKHNERNGEQNRDGTDDNASWNCGIEGPNGSPDGLRLRLKMKRNFLATLMLSQGVPMLPAGDEWSRTQRGNNNAYCQDNDLSWVHWDGDEERKELLAFVQHLGQIRRSHPTLRRRYFFEDHPTYDGSAMDVRWLRWDGVRLTAADWRNPETRCFGMLIDGDRFFELDDQGQAILDDTLLLLINSFDDSLPFHLPELERAGVWESLIDTQFSSLPAPTPTYASAATYPMAPKSLVLLRWGTPSDAVDSRGNSPKLP